jgi:hypothetical protein
MVFARLAGESVNKTTISLGVARTAVFNVMTAYASKWRISSAKKNSGRKQN